MEKSLIVCTTKKQAQYAKEYLEGRGAKTVVEPINDITLSEADGNPPNCDFQGKYARMGDGLFLVTGTWD